jgi:methanogenic corrinoid protein MtbC1
MTTQDIFNAVLAFDEATATAKTRAELDAGTEIDAILNNDQIGADGYSADAPGAVKLVKQLVV